MKTGGWKLMTLILVVACGLFLVGCAGHFGSWDEQWYSAHPLSKADVIAKWGTPDRVISHDDGLQELVYLRAIPPSGAKSALVYQIRNEMVVKQCWKAM